MNMTLSDVEFETRTIGPLVLTTPCLRRLGLREIINRLCPVAEQADFDHGLVAEALKNWRPSSLPSMQEPAKPRSAGPSG